MDIASIKRGGSCRLSYLPKSNVYLGIVFDLHGYSFYKEGGGHVDLVIYLNQMST